MKKIITIAFFAILLVIGLLIYNDYGISYDEPVQRDIGTMNYEFIVNGNQSLLDDQFKNYPSLFDIFLAFIEKGLGMTDNQEIFLMRHLMNFLLFYVSVIFFYKLLLKWLNWPYSLIGCLFLVLSPRIFANAFYNNKDLAFMSVYIIALYYSFELIKKHSFKNIFLSALITGMLIDMRVLGLILPFTVLMILCIDSLLNINSKNKEYQLKISKLKISITANNKLLTIISYLTLLSTSIIIFWPLLWVNPLNNFIESLIKLFTSSFWQTTVLYFGKYIHCTQLPWHYIPVWIFLTTPLLYTCLFIIGSIIALKNSIKSYQKNKQTIITLFLFFGPVIVFISQQLALYNGWRHLYFLYPLIILISVYGLKWLVKKINKIKLVLIINKSKIKIKKLLKYSLIALMILLLTNTLFRMIYLHPLQCVYFNELINPSWAKQNFPIDYWGLSVIQGLECIVQTDNRTNITLGYESFAFNLLTKEDLNRLNWNTNETIDYWINNYDHNIYESPDPYCTVERDGIRIMEVNKFT